MNVQEHEFYGARVFYDREKRVYGVSELPEDFVAVAGARVLIKGTPHRDVLQAAFAHVGFQRASIERRPFYDERTTGLLLDLVA